MTARRLLAAFVISIAGLALPAPAGVAFADRVMVDDDNGNTTCIDFDSRGSWWTYNDRTGDLFGSLEMDDIWVNRKGQLRFRDTNWIYHLNSERRIQGRLSSRGKSGKVSDYGLLAHSGNTWFENRKSPKQKFLVEGEVAFDHNRCYIPNFDPPGPDPRAPKPLPRAVFGGGDPQPVAPPSGDPPPGPKPDPPQAPPGPGDPPRTTPPEDRDRNAPRPVLE